MKLSDEVFRGINRKVYRLPHTWGDLEPNNDFYEIIKRDYQRESKPSALDLREFGPGYYKLRLGGRLYYAQVCFGLSLELSPESFEHSLKIANASELSQRQIDALEHCAREGMATKEQRMTLYYWECHHQLVKIRRNALSRGRKRQRIGEQ